LFARSRAWGVVSLTSNGSSPALLISLAFHAVAVAGAGLQPFHVRPMRSATPLEIPVEIEAAPPPLSLPTPQPPPQNEASVAAPSKAAAVRREPVAVRAVAATEPKAAPQPAPPADAPVALTGGAQLPHFSIATSITAAPAESLAKTSGAATAFQGTPDRDAPYAEDAVDVPARAAKKVAPRYPLEAQSSGTEATVKMEIVLSSSGVVQTVRALNHPGHGFEEEAIAAAHRTPFTPAMKRGQAVPVRMAWTVEFRLQ
jgi:TonB family protein